MDWLSGWLKSIILIVLLATFVDILLPSQTMQRYVKTVMGLFILLTLLTPLFSIFETKGTMDQMLSQAMKQTTANGLKLYASDSSKGSPPEMETLSAIEQQAEQLKARQEEQSQKLLQQQMSALMKKSIEQNAGIKVQRVDVETAKDPQGQVIIQHVAVTASVQEPAGQQAKPQAGTSPPITIEPMKPVDIQIRQPVQSDSADQAAAAAGSSGYEKEQTQIRMLLNREWQVPADQVSVSIQPGKVKS